MLELAYYTKAELLRDLAAEVVAVPSVSDDLKAAELDSQKLVDALLNRPELLESIEREIDEPVAQANRLEKEIDALGRELGYLGQSTSAGVDYNFGRTLSLLCYLLGAAIACFALVAWCGGLELRPFAWAVIVATCLSLIALCRFLAESDAVAEQPLRSEAQVANRADIEKRLEVAKAEYAALRSQIPADVRDRVLTPIARRILEEWITPSYEPILQGAPEPLGEVWAARFETETKSRNELKHLFSAMSGGSIGISGARGSGKSTLINYFCRRSEKWQPRDRPVLAFSTPAPALYEARDFVLHLFGTLCRTVLKEVGEEFDSESEYRRARSYHPALVAFFPYTRAMSGIGMLMVLASVVVFYLHFANIVYPSANSQLRLQAEMLETLSQKLGLHLGPFLLIGGALWLIGGWLARIESIMRKEAARRPEFPTNGDKLNLSREARIQLDKIRFQRTFTSGWTGTLSLPFSLTANEAQQLAERQESLPEIVERYSNFVHRVRSDFTLIIGIDELDKLKSDEQAESFLNDNKVLFGLEGCFYLVSISESALARFERRGLPLRDTFDSSFDEVLHVGYLDTQRAIKLLRRRVARLPVPFACLCHCLSGGLPRDIIRVCRSLYVIADETKKSSLHELTKALMQEDLYKKYRAMALSAKQLDTSYASDFIISLNYLDDMEPAVKLIDECARYFFALLTLPEKSTDEDRRLAVLCMEFGSYLLYWATVLALFGDPLKASEIQKAETDGLFDRLAKARQSLSVDPKLSWYMCVAFRKEIGLPCPSPETEPQLMHVQELAAAIKEERQRAKVKAAEQAAEDERRKAEQAQREKEEAERAEAKAAEQAAEDERRKAEQAQREKEEAERAEAKAAEQTAEPVRASVELDRKRETGVSGVLGALTLPILGFLGVGFLAPLNQWMENLGSGSRLSTLDLTPAAAPTKGAGPASPEIPPVAVVGQEGPENPSARRTGYQREVLNREQCSKEWKSKKAKILKTNPKMSWSKFLVACDKGLKE